MAKKKVDPLAAKAARQKKIAIVGAVLLLAVMAFQVPRTLKMINKQPPAVAAYVDTTAAPATPGADVPLAPPTLGGGAAPAATPDASGGAEGEVATATLIAFDRFESKDPFSPQLGPGSPGSPAAGGGAGGETAPVDGAPTEDPGDAPAPGTGVPAPTAPGFTPTPGSGGGSVARTSAVLSVNGTAETVAAAGVFPADSPLFVLVSVSTKSVKLAIADGTYADGRETITLEAGKPLTLVNTADGTRYELRLVSTS